MLACQEMRISIGLEQQAKASSYPCLDLRMYLLALSYTVVCIRIKDGQTGILQRMAVLLHCIFSAKFL